MFKLMIVDDERIIRQGIRYAIDWSKENIQVICEAANGQEAVHLAAQLLPDIVICDIRMPIMDGLEFAQKIRQSMPNLYIIMLSGFNDTNYMQTAIEAGVNAYLMKSADSLQIVDAVLKGCAQIMANKSILDNNVKITSIFNENIFAIRAEFMKQLLDFQSTITPDSSSFETLEIDLCGPKYALILFQYQEGNILSFISTLEIAFKSFNPFIAFFDTNDVVAILNLPNTNVDILQEILQTMKLHPSLQPPLPIIFANNATDILDIKAKYQQICSIKKGIHWFSDKTAIDVADVALTSQPYSFFMELEMRVIAQIKTNQQNAAAILICDYFKHAKNSLVSMEILQGFASRVLTAKYILEDHTSMLCSDVPKITQAETHSEIYDILEKTYSINAAQNCHKSESLNKILQYIDENFASELNLSEIAEKIYLSSGYLGQIFRTEMGIGIKEYIHKKRIEVAKELLKNSEIKIYEVATMVGYKNYKHFSMYFLKYANCSARDFRKNIFAK